MAWPPRCWPYLAEEPDRGFGRKVKVVALVLVPGGLPFNRRARPSENGALRLVRFVSGAQSGKGLLS